MLRRVKEEVEKDLPAKKEVTVTCPLTPMQVNWYRKLIVRDEVTQGTANCIGPIIEVRPSNCALAVSELVSQHGAAKSQLHVPTKTCCHWTD